MRTEKSLWLYRSTPAHVALGIVIAGSFVLPAIAFAQTPPKPLPPSPPEVMEPPGESAAPTPDPSTGNEKPKEPLSKELQQGEGVIEPPRGADPDIEKKPPQDFESKTPVIPPPGEAGGNPDVQPK